MSNELTGRPGSRDVESVDTVRRIAPREPDFARSNARPLNSYRVDGVDHHRSLVGFVVGLAVALFLSAAGWACLTLLAAFQ